MKQHLLLLRINIMKLMYEYDNQLAELNELPIETVDDNAPMVF
jgi:hypothetical protein